MKISSELQIDNFNMDYQRIILNLWCNNNLEGSWLRLSKNTKDKLIQKGGSLSQSKVKSYLENADLSNGTIEKGKDIPYNKR